MMENPELLPLHARQQNAVYPKEKTVQVSSWMKALSRTMQRQLEEEGRTLLKKTNQSLNEDQVVLSLGKKLDGLAKLLGLYPYNKKSIFKGQLKAVSHSKIQPVLVICPDSVVCQSLNCNPRSLKQNTRDKAIPLVDLIKGTNNFRNVPVLTGICLGCKTTYYADHERFIDDNQEWKRVYLNSAKYFKVGQSTWLTRNFQTLF
jgi:hypothetical protein